MVVRMALGGALAAACALCGRSMAGAARRRAATLASLTSGLRALRLRMMSLFEPVQAGLSASDCPLLRQIADGMKDGGGAGEAWTALSRHRGRGAMDCLSIEDRRILEALFDRLGESGREAQELLLSGAVQALDAQCVEAKKCAAEAERLYVTLGLLIGLMLALVIG